MFLIKTLVYIIVAAAMIFTVISLGKQSEPTSAKTQSQEESAPLVATSSESAGNETAKNPEKDAASEPKPKPLVPVALPAIPTQNFPPAINPSSPLLPSAEVAPTTTTQNGMAPTQVPALSLEEINKKTRAALVNIICTTLRSGSFEPLTGSGIIIDARGVILTNAHVAEYFLLENYMVPNFVGCVIRTGEPARNHYKATLLYISPLWIEGNYKKIRLADPTGTGEHDFAFLLITESVNPETLPLPKTFPALAMDFTDETLRNKNQVLAAGYPAGFLSGINIQKDLYPSSSIVTVEEVYTFQKNTPDVFSVGGSVIAQKGASGGAIVSGAGKLIGLIVTSSEAATTDARNLNAITPSHIARSFREHTGNTIQELFSGDLAASTESFNKNVAPALTKLLEDEINKHP